MKDKQVKLNQVIQNFYNKAAQVIVQGRINISPVYSRGQPKINKWFNLDLEETDAFREELKQWRSIDAFDSQNAIPPLVVETYLDAKNLNSHQSLVLETSDGRSEPVFKDNSMTEVVIERWIVEFVNGNDSNNQDDLPVIYKKCIVLFRALYAHCRFLPAWTLKKKFRSKLNISPINIGCRVLNGSYPISSKGRIGLTKPIVDCNDGHLQTFTFGDVNTPIGSLKISVSYRVNNDFKVRDSESLFSQYLDDQQNQYNQQQQQQRPPSFQPFKSPSLSASPGESSGSNKFIRPQPQPMPHQPPSSSTTSTSGTGGIGVAASRYSSSFGYRNSFPNSSVGSNSSVEPGSGFYVDDDDVGNFVKLVDSTKLLKLHDSTVEDPLSKFQMLRGNHAALTDSMQSSLYVPSSNSTNIPTTNATSTNTNTNPTNIALSSSPHRNHMPLVPSRLSEEYKANDESRYSAQSARRVSKDETNYDDELLFAMSDMPE